MYFAGKPYKIFFAALPASYTDRGVYGVTFEEVDEYHVFIDPTPPPEVQKHILKHELSHIVKNHFFRAWQPIEEQEIEAERCAYAMTDEGLQALINGAKCVKWL